MLAAVVLLAALPAAPAAKTRTAQEALQPFAVLIGSWKGTGTPTGTTAERENGLWQERLTWSWQFKGDRAWLNLAIEKGKHYQQGTLEYVADTDSYRLTLIGTDKAEAVFAGMLKGKVLTLDRTDTDRKEQQRLVITLLHDNRYLYRYETKPEAGGTLARRYQVGATKEGVAFASASQGPECIVTGGAGTMKVTHKGKTYFVCCTGCRDAFLENPEKFIAAAAKPKPKGD